MLQFMKIERTFREIFWAPLSVFHSRFFVPLRSTKRAPFKPGRKVDINLKAFNDRKPLQIQ
jgi:hypothetical protein